MLFLSTEALTGAVVHIFHLHHLGVDSPSEQVAGALCRCLAVF